MTKAFKKILAASMMTALTTGSIAQAADFNGTLYLESTNSLKLYAPAILANGDRALAPKVELPSEAIMAIDLTLVDQALTISKDSPERVNFPFVDTLNETKVRRNGKGWICGLRVVDAAEVDLRESDDVEGNDFCLSLENLNSVKALETNGELALNSYHRFERNADLSLMNKLARDIKEVQRRKQEYGELSLIANKAIISPIKNCGKGCLAVSSEFGNRIHPVYKTRKMHKGIDLKAASGTSVVSVFPGKVLSNRTERNKARKIVGYGHYVIVVHPEQKMETLYAHLSKFKRDEGVSVGQGDQIALSGATGTGTGPHLHFETHAEKKGGGYSLVNPRSYIGNMLPKVASWVLKVFSFV